MAARLPRFHPRAPPRVAAGARLQPAALPLSYAGLVPAPGSSGAEPLVVRG